jgi:DNA (cytosine-5)-methyltransferase 1
MSRAKPTAVDLFAGAGGLSEGLRQAGYRIVGAVEIDALAGKAYRSNHPRVKLWTTDISMVSGPALLRESGLRRGDLDLLAACPPCQGFSTLRTNNGMKRNRDPQNGLIGEVLRLVRSLSPKAVMLENVPGLAKSVRYLQFRRALASLGYHVEWDIFDVAAFGVPQRRRRLVLLALKAAKPNFAKGSSRERTVRKAIGALTAPAKSSDHLHNYFVTRSEKVAALIRRIPKNGGSRTALDSDQQLRCHKKCDGFRDVYGRMRWSKPAPTITGGCINPSKGRFIHPSANRAITLREAALLQSFPKSYRFPLDQGRYAAALLIGNALPPEFIRRHAVALRRSLESVEPPTKHLKNGHIR